MDNSTSASFVYFVLAENTTIVKIGRSNNPKKRLVDLQIGSPVPLRLVLVVPEREAITEKHLHAEFDRQRSHGEWFKMSERQVRELCEGIIPAPLQFSLTDLLPSLPNGYWWDVREAKTCYRVRLRFRAEDRQAGLALPSIRRRMVSVLDGETESDARRLVADYFAGTLEDRLIADPANGHLQAALQHINLP